MQGEKVKCIANINIEKSAIVYIQASQKANQNLYQTELENLLSVINKFNASSKDYQKIHTSNGTWYCTFGLKSIVYLLLVNNNYPPEAALKLLEKSQKELELMAINVQAMDPSIKEKLKNVLDNLMKKYEDPAQMQAQEPNLENIKIVLDPQTQGLSIPDHRLHQENPEIGENETRDSIIYKLKKIWKDGSLTVKEKMAIIIQKIKEHPIIFAGVSAAVILLIIII